jgi:hypothetical protein
MIKRCLAAATLVMLLLGGCGDKVPESQAAKRLGEVPKQVVDKAATDSAQAMQRGAERNRDAE